MSAAVISTITKPLSHEKTCLRFITLLLINDPTLRSEPAQPESFLLTIKCALNISSNHLVGLNALANYAQQWVDHLAKTQNCEMIHRPNENGGQFQQIHGENLFWASPEVISAGANTIIKKIQRFHPQKL